MIEKVPVFWIHGRSWDGKSVLLLQVAATLLERRAGFPLLQLNSGDELPELIRTMPDCFGDTDTSARAIAIVDDLYQIRAIDVWDDAVYKACAHRVPPLAIITCGPTEQLEQFEARHSDQFEVRPSCIPPLDLDEYREFVQWYENRTHQKRDLKKMTTENALLGHVVFELAQGERLPAFARRFRRRLEQISLFEMARTILAANALYVEAPSTLLPDDQSCDALERLCREDQMHFRLTTVPGLSSPSGIWLAHPHLSFQIFREWIDPPATFAKTWARELARVLTVLERTQSEATASTLLYRVMTVTQMSDTAARSPMSPMAARREIMRELYRQHIKEHGGVPVDSLLPRWLDIVSKVARLMLMPDPVECAVSAMRDENRAQYLHGSIGGWSWRLAGKRSTEEAARVRECTRQFFTRWATSPGIAMALARIAAQPDHESRRL